MHAGKTIYPIGTRIRIAYLNSDCPEDQALVGQDGVLTRPFPGAKSESPGKCIAGVRIKGSDGEEAWINLTAEDRFELLEPELVRTTEVKAVITQFADCLAGMGAEGERLIKLADLMLTGHMNADMQQGFLDDAKTRGLFNAIAPAGSAVKRPAGPSM